MYSVIHCHLVVSGLRQRTRPASLGRRTSSSPHKIASQFFGDPDSILHDTRALNLQSMLAATFML